MANPVVGSQVVSVGELLLGGVFVPANVQRVYCWAKPQQSALLQDLIAAFQEFGFDPESEVDAEEHSPDSTEDGEDPFPLADSDPDIDASAPISFLGAMVLYPGKDGFQIYDGLQRLTTLIVLFAVLRDLVGPKSAKDEINPLLATDDGRFRLDMAMKHETLRTDIFAPGRTAKRYRELPDITEAGERLRECVATMRGALKTWSETRLLAFVAFVRDRALVSAIEIGDRRLAGRAFVDINSGGVALKPEEILKGQLIDLAQSAPPNIEDPEGRILFVWQVLNDEFGKEGFDDFLRSVDFLERRAKQSPDYAIQLMEHIRRSYGGADGFKWATDRLLQYRSAFRWVYEGQDDEIAAGVRASLRRLQLLKWDQWRAFAMLLKIKSRPQDLDKRIEVLDRMCFALTLTYEDGRKCAELLGRRLERFAKGSFGRNGGFAFKEPQHKRILRTLGSPLSDSRRGSIMRWLEAAHHGDRVPRYLIDEGSSVEHVYPKNPGNNWLAFEKDTDIENTATLLDMTGNLCVLPEDELGNASFEEKRKAYQRLRNCKFANEIASARQWTPDAIRARTEKLRDWTLAHLDLDILPDDEKPGRRR
jgi:hypothetical protein